jgi:hypothetical protein
MKVITASNRRAVRRPYVKPALGTRVRRLVEEVRKRQPKRAIGSLCESRDCTDIARIRITCAP